MRKKLIFLIFFVIIVFVILWGHWDIYLYNLYLDFKGEDIHKCLPVELPGGNNYILTEEGGKLLIRYCVLNLSDVQQERQEVMCYNLPLALFGYNPPEAIKRWLSAYAYRLRGKDIKLKQIEEGSCMNGYCAVEVMAFNPKCRGGDIYPQRLIISTYSYKLVNKFPWDKSAIEEYVLCTARGCSQLKNKDLSERCRVVKQYFLADFKYLRSAAPPILRERILYNGLNYDFAPLVTYDSTNIGFIYGPLVERCLSSVE